MLGSVFKLSALKISGLLTLLSAPVAACDLALALAVDVSGSVDPAEYRIQMDGLALGLRDGIVADALVRANAAVMLVQWSGESRQVTTIPWTRLSSFDDVAALADRVSLDRRMWRNYSTAIGDALHHTLGEFASVTDCKRRVIDVSGDGVSNEGRAPIQLRAALRRADVTVNALVIETDKDVDLTGYFWENVITGEGAFVVTANGFADYPQRIRQKLIRETTRQLATLKRFEKNVNHGFLSKRP